MSRQTSPPPYLPCTRDGQVATEDVNPKDLNNTHSNTLWTDTDSFDHKPYSPLPNVTATRSEDLGSVTDFVFLIVTLLLLILFSFSLGISPRSDVVGHGLAERLAH